MHRVMSSSVSKSHTTLRKIINQSFAAVVNVMNLTIANIDDYEYIHTEYPRMTQIKRTM